MQRLFQRAFGQGLVFSAWLARSPTLRRLSGPLMRALAWSTFRLRRGKPQPDAAGLAAEWSRLMPSRRHFPVTGVEGQTAHTEIRASCPLRGTGDVAACHRMMAYDRALVERLGGQLVVLASQAEPGVSHCRLAIRPAGAPLDDLVPAHVRVGGKRQG